MLTVFSLPGEAHEGHPASFHLPRLRREVMAASEDAARHARHRPYRDFVESLYAARTVLAHQYLGGAKGITEELRGVLVDISDGEGATYIHHRHCDRADQDRMTKMLVRDRQSVAIAAAAARLTPWGGCEWGWLRKQAEDAVQEHACLKGDALPERAYPAMFAADWRSVGGAAAILDGEPNPQFAATDAAMEAATEMAERIEAQRAMAPEE